MESLREDNEFAEVALAYENEEKVETHQGILIASSPFIQDRLRRYKHQPLTYIRRVESVLRRH